MLVMQAQKLTQQTRPCQTYGACTDAESSELLKISRQCSPLQAFAQGRDRLTARIQTGTLRDCFCVYDLAEVDLLSCLSQKSVSVHFETGTMHHKAANMIRSTAPSQIVTTLG